MEQTGSQKVAFDKVIRSFPTITTTRHQGEPRIEVRVGLLGRDVFLLREGNVHVVLTERLPTGFVAHAVAEAWVRELGVPMRDVTDWYQRP